MTSPRYAIYLAPPPDAPLWAFGSRVLGYDAVLGQDVLGFAPEGCDAAHWRSMTERPRTYGFHATLNAPFHLADGKSERELFAELDAFCRSQARFDLGALAVEAIASATEVGFVALTQRCPSLELEALEHDAVRAFDHFRAPLSEKDIGKRRPETLSARQWQSLLQFGYPYVGPDYKFHMTLTGAIPDVADVADRLADVMANEIGTAHLDVDGVVLFRQDAEGGCFRVLRRFAFQEDHPSLTIAASTP